MEDVAPGGTHLQPLQTVVFRLGGEHFGVNAGNVNEIVRAKTLTPVVEGTGAAHWLLDLRGKAIPVLSLHRRIGVPEPPRTEGSRVLVVDAGGSTVGILVDAVTDVVVLEGACAAEGHRLTGKVPTAGFARRDGELIPLLDLEQGLAA